jgi:hypothetical protein
VPERVESAGFIFRSPLPVWWGSSPGGSGNSFDFSSLLEATADLLVEERFGVRVHRTGIISILLERYFEVVQSFGTLGDDVRDELLEHRADAMRHLNALSLCLNAAVTARSGFDPGATLVDAENLLALRYDDQSNLVGATGPDPELDGMLRNRTRERTVDAASLEEGLLLFEAVVTNQYVGALDATALLNEALCSYKRHSFSASVVAAWSVCERLQKSLWEGEREVGDAAQAPLGGSGGRTSNRDPRASEVTRDLRRSGTLTRELADQLDQAASARNVWLHRAQAPSRAQAESCLDAATAMAGRVFGIELALGKTLLGNV